MKRFDKFSKEELQNIVARSLSFTDVLSSLGYKLNGKRRRQLIECLNYHGIEFANIKNGAGNKARLRTKHPSIVKTCPVCGNKFNTKQRIPTDKRNVEKKYCSTSCCNKIHLGNRYKNYNILPAQKAIWLTKEKRRVERPNETEPIKTYQKGAGKEERKCLICNRSFVVYRTYSKKCCSRSCGKVLQFGSLPFTKEEMIEKILELAQSGDFQKRKASTKLVSSAIKFFGTWNKAVQFCGLTPNTQIYSKKRITCSDGHVVDSLSEKIIDQWLSEQKINHEIHKKYPESNWICDFYLIDYGIWIEYFGLYNEVEEYTEVAKQKIEFCKSKGLKLVTLFPDDLYDTKDFDKKILNLVTEMKC